MGWTNGRDSGLKITRPDRVRLDRKPFARKAQSDGEAAFLLDGSGSMSWQYEQIMALIDGLPFSTLGIYDYVRVPTEVLNKIPYATQYVQSSLYLNEYGRAAERSVEGGEYAVLCVLYILANKGNVISEKQYLENVTIGGNNGCDFPAARWLEKQRGSKTLITDCGWCGVFGGANDEMEAQMNSVIRRSRIKVVGKNEALEAVKW